MLYQKKISKIDRDSQASNAIAFSNSIHSHPLQQQKIKIKIKIKNQRFLQSSSAKKTT